MEPRYTVNGRRLTEKYSQSSSRNVRKAVDARLAYLRGDTPLPDDGVRRARDGRIITEKWLESNRVNASKVKHEKRVEVSCRERGRNVEIPDDFLERLNDYAGGVMKRVKLLVRVVGERVDYEIANNLSPMIPPVTRVPGGKKTKAVLLPIAFLDKVDTHIGDKHKRIRYIIGIMEEYMKNNPVNTVKKS